jgi:four helix bundle protein
MAIVEEEADESAYWIELLVESGQVKEDRVSALRAEAREITAIAAASRKTARRHSNRQSTIDNRQLQ